MLARARCRGTVAVALVLVVACSRAVAAGPLEFSYEVARFELDGSAFGALDGAADFVDEFDDGAIAPNWYQAYGTVSEHDGSLFLTSPGASYPTPLGDTTIVSIAAAQANSWVADGDGSFAATAYWEPLLPPQGYHYHFSLFTFGGGSGGFFSEIFGVGFGGIDGGLSFEQHRTEIDQAHGVYQNTMLDYLAIDPTQISGRIGMRIHFDDVTNEAWTAFSLDGGLTWQSPFPHGTVFVGRTTGQLLLSADPSASAPPVNSVCSQALAAGPTRLTLRKVGADPFPGNDSLNLVATAALPTGTGFADLHPDTRGARLVVRGQPSGNVLLDAAIPAGAYAGHGTAGWRSRGGGHTWTFADKRPSAPDGVVRVTLSDRSPAGGPGLVKIALQAAGGTYPLVPADVALDVAIVLGDDADAAAGRCGRRTFTVTECAFDGSGRSLSCRH
ncbi:MAG: hypothetical protein U0802_18790 [Candidatus Binatia bacterium]